jgi:hypothetical protein
MEASMFPVRWIPRLVPVLALAAVLVLTAGPVGAATGSVQVGPTATRVVLGVAVDVPVTASLTCDEGFDVGLVDVFVVQARGTSLITGSGQTTFACNGETQNLTVRAGGGVFHGGPALVTATLLQCQGVGANLTCFFTDISTSEEIRIRGG